LDKKINGISAARPRPARLPNVLVQTCFLIFLWKARQSCAAGARKFGAAGRIQAPHNGAEDVTHKIRVGNPRRNQLASCPANVTSEVGEEEGLLLQIAAPLSLVALWLWFW
jgi:hypothetical protein